MLKTNSFKRVRKKYRKLVDTINSLEDNLKTLSDIELRAKNLKLQKQYQETRNLSPLIAESFALTREASLRTIGLRHFDVQLIGGIVLNDQRIAEMKTGEGKTLVATLPACLNALTGRGVHIVTVNNYLASRDQVSMSPIYRFLGLYTGLVQDKMSKPERKKNYNADITYVTNYEVAFDYLRDNTAFNLKDVVLRPFNYCILDEVDSILIDEAQTPLVLGDDFKTSALKYIIASEITQYLGIKIHYTIDEKNRNIVLTDEGSKQIEKLLQTNNLYNPDDPWISYVINAIKANALFFNNVHYIIQNNDRITIVDESTGRLMPDRRWSDGLHQAIEAKENVTIRDDSKIQAAITYQNFFLSYPKLSGMTGTGKTAEIEFEKIYNLSVEEIPTARPNLRKDFPDLIYKDQFSKWNAVVQNCSRISSTGQPILIGTTSVEKSEMLAQLLNEYKLSYQILNAKPQNVRRESEIIAQAGKKNAITVATNLAGRGTDIILGGNINFQIQKELYHLLILLKNAILPQKKAIFQFLLKNQLNSNSQKFLSVLFSLITNDNFLKLSDLDILKILRKNDSLLFPDTSYKCSVKFLINEFTVYYKKQQKQENKIVKNLGGLYIIGTERNKSRRVDNQLRGRCGRQGDPGTSTFFLSLDDNLLRLFGGPRFQRFMRKQIILDNAPLQSRFLTKSLNAAQQQIEERAYQQRKNLFDYDEVVNKQREVLYFERRQLLKNVLKNAKLLGYGELFLVETFFELKQRKKTSELQNQLIEFLQNVFMKPVDTQTSEFLNERTHLPDFKRYLLTDFWSISETKEKEFGVRGSRGYVDFARNLILSTLDQVWSEHLQKIAALRENVRWRGYGQQTPLSSYKKEAFYLFEERQIRFRFLLLSKLLQDMNI